MFAGAHIVAGGMRKVMFVAPFGSRRDQDIFLDGRLHKSYEASVLHSFCLRTALMASPQHGVEGVTVKMGRLEISVKVTGESRNDSEWEVVEGTSEEQSGGQQVVNATTMDSLNQLISGPLAFLKPLANKLHAKDSVWSSDSRIARAYQKGVLARLGVADGHSFPSIPFKPSHYFCFECPDHPDGFWTTSKKTIQSKMGDDDAVCFMCASRSEGDAFLLGAKRSWPQFLK